MKTKEEMQIEWLSKNKPSHALDPIKSLPTPEELDVIESLRRDKDAIAKMKLLEAIEVRKAKHAQFAEQRFGIEMQSSLDETSLNYGKGC